MRRGQTTRDAIYGLIPGVNSLSRRWDNDRVKKMLNCVWAAYDRLHSSKWQHLDWTKHYDDLERDMTEQLEKEMNRLWDRRASVYVQYAPAERSSRANPPAAPPVYDIAFILNADPRIIWPLEAKVLRSDRDTNENLSDYIDTAKNRFLTGYYAPYVGGAAMLGYMKLGDPIAVTTHIGTRLDSAIDPNLDFPTRCHSMTDHLRPLSLDKDITVDFRLHHLIMPLS